MDKRSLYLLICFLMVNSLTACTVKNYNKAVNPVTTIDNQIESCEEIYNWSAGPDRNNPEQIKQIIKMLVNVDFKKLNQLEMSKGKEIQFYEPFYNYPDHTVETIEDIFKIREATDKKNQWDRLIFDLNRKEKLKPIFKKITESDPKYKTLLDNITKTETNVYLIYNWGISENKDDPKQIEKVLKIIGDVDFSRLWDIETQNNKQIDFYKPFCNYPNYNFQTIQNLFEAKTDGAISEEIDGVIFYLYKKRDVKPIIEEVVSSNPKYQERLNFIIKYESQ